MGRHNKSHGHGTINQGIAHSHPKWQEIGGGVLVRKGTILHAPNSNPISLQGGEWRSVSFKKEEKGEATWEKVFPPGTLADPSLPPAPETGKLPMQE